MTETVIKVKCISKKYQIGRVATGDLRGTLSGLFKLINSTKNKSQDFWALKDISFEVQKGEVIGIIGSNGAGKSTLLKILSRITSPTSGHIEITGKVASLLEVGTGFHPELTGRENIFLNGSLLGMKKKEIIAKFDEIIGFSGVEKFIDTPVKHYSSGMYVRLAFAVAAHLDPEILIVDEVLAVGDIAFQQKCLGKMDEVAQGGKTVIFVSHNLGAVQQLCSRGILLENGELKKVGKIQKVVNAYLHRLQIKADLPIKERVDRIGSGLVSFTDGYMLDENDFPIQVARSGQSIKIVLKYSSKLSSTEDIIVKIECRDKNGNYVFICDNRINNEVFKLIPNNGKFICHIPNLPLSEGRYYLDLFVFVNGKKADVIYGGMKLEVFLGHYYPTGLQPARFNGVLIDYLWKYE